MPRTADWFSALSKKAQAEYIKAHPNSKYAKGAKAAASNTTAAKKVDPAAIKLKVKLKQQLAATREKIKDFKAQGIKGPRLINLLHKRDDLKNKLSSITSGAKAHEAKRATDKNKAVTKTPSANAGKPHALTLTQAKVKDVKAKLAKLKPGGAAHTKATAELKMLNARLRFQKGKIKNGYAEAPVKVVKRTAAKKPSSKGKGGNIKQIKPISGANAKETKLKQTIAGLRLSLQGFATTSPGYKARKAKYDKARAELKALKAKK